VSNSWDAWIVNGMWIKGTPRTVIEDWFKAQAAAVVPPAPVVATPVAPVVAAPAPVAPAPAPVAPAKVALVGFNISDGK